ncbi:2-dehydropantoate 2-reductase (Ketopantoate reductase) (KPA reductase) (KPR) [Malassezia pachydermatis]|uniref:2-dehydropantoate 2-reductase n=1 Tax=Malassezia pachydermatis TaxID=77020 RepID=A0A0M8MN66_9BASI|nr:2-dehydropantoate 2-reductase [Malassezia pachydermatis]KOS15876.1 2-dehydropantoate 2-reductase [Malassezia pachydermatis]
MHVHVLGVGAIGTLIAAHVRAMVRQRSMAATASSVPSWRFSRVPMFVVPQHVAPFWPDATTTTVTLHMRDRMYDRAKEPRKPGASVTVERDGARLTETGFHVELTSPADPSQPRYLAPDAHGVLQDQPGTPPLPIDSLIVTTKADATYAALAPLAPRITPATTIVLLQNGMGVLDMLLERIWQHPDSRPHFVLASATHGCYVKRPLHTVHAGFGSMHLGLVPSAMAPRAETDASLERPLPPVTNATQPELDLAAIPDAPYTRSVRETLALLLSLPLDVHWEPIRAFQLRALRKLIINACINPTTALADCKNGDLFGAPNALDLFRALCTEASQVLEAHARDAKAAQASRETDAAHLSTLPLADLLTQTDADGLPLLDTSLKPASMLHEVENVVRATAANWSSMHQDVYQRRGRTEIDFMNGYLSELGRAYGIPTPTHDMMTNLIKLKTQRATGSWRTRAM